MSYIPYSRQNITRNEVEAVGSVLKSDFLTQGPKVQEFEKALSQTVNSKYCIAVNSATAGLHLACLSLGVGHGDLVWTVPNSFVASANCALYCGASIDFVDIQIGSRNICLEAFAEKLQKAAFEGRLPKVLITVHFGGNPSELQSLKNLCDRHGVKIIEDASHALGARYKNSIIGDCTYSEITVFSFHPVKMITTGEGGAITTNDEALYGKLSSLRSHGITREASCYTTFNDEPWVYEQQSLGFNYRLSDIGCALGIEQLKRISDFVEKRNKIAEYYLDQDWSNELMGQAVDATSTSSWHIYTLYLPLSIDRKEAFVKLRSLGIGVNVHYIPIHTQPYFRELGFSVGDFKQSETYYNQAITIPLHPSMTDNEVEFVSQSVRDLCYK